MRQDKILVIEDELDIAEPIRCRLFEEGYQAVLAPNGELALRHLQAHWDLVVLDLMLPDMSGEAILGNLKQRPDYPSVLILTARGTMEDKLSLFRQGCDDYLTKPFALEELVQRVRALLRRSSRVRSDESSYGDLTLDPETFCLHSKQSSVFLTPKEASILRLMMANPGQIISRREVLHHVWGLKEEPDTNFIAVHLFKLRKKLAEIKRDSWLLTIRNSGFMLRESTCTDGNTDGN